MQILFILIALAALGGGYFFLSGDKAMQNTNPTVAQKTDEVDVPAPTPTTPTPAAPTPTQPIAAPTPAPVAMKKKYIDGQYSAEGSYVIPNKETEKITVSLTLKDGIVTEVSQTANPKEQASILNHKKFSESYKQFVVGKSIDEIALTVVNGASLTSKGFMGALEAIKTKATQA
jgi:uncharacterized protein with FMN-binding domain